MLLKFNKKKLNFKQKTYYNCRSNREREKEEKKRWPATDREHERIRRNSGGHSQPSLPPQIAGTTQRSSMYNDPRDSRTTGGAYGGTSTIDSERWNQRDR